MAKTILLVEDEIDLSMTISGRLRTAGYACNTADDALSALGMLKQSRFDLLIVDLMLPGISGVSFIGMLKKEEYARGIPVIVLTAIDDERTKAECEALGARDYIVKPYEAQTLLAKVKEALGE